jgi:hypothetical protein
VQSTAKGVSLVGVSIPRSGHHFLAKLLENALGDDLAYCEFYSAADCCRQLPCIRRHRSRITYQKNHDMDLAIDPDLPGVRYVVQYRNPVPAVVSDRELFAEVRGSALARDRSQYVMVLSEKAAHYARFYDKWVRHPHGSRFLMKYEWLCDAPAEAIDALIRFCGFSVTAERIAGAVAKVAPVVNRPPIVKDSGEARFAARDPARSAYFDPDLLATYESLVLDRVPELSTDRLFAPVGYAAHPLSAMFEVQCARLDGRHADAARLAQAAHRQWPVDPYIGYVAAECLRKTGDREAALSHLERALDAASHDAQIVGSCASLNFELGNAPRADELAAQLVALVPTEPGFRLFHAATRFRLGFPDQALERALSAAELGMQDPGLWQQFASIMREARRAGWGLAVTRRDDP